MLGVGCWSFGVWCWVGIGVWCFASGSVVSTQFERKIEYLRVGHTWRDKWTVLSGPLSYSEYSRSIMPFLTPVRATCPCRSATQGCLRETVRNRPRSAREPGMNALYLRTLEPKHYSSESTRGGWCPGGSPRAPHALTAPPPRAVWCLVFGVWCLVFGVFGTLAVLGVFSALAAASPMPVSCSVFSV